MAFTRNPTFLWNDKPISNCSQSELEEAILYLLKKNRLLERELERKEFLDYTSPGDMINGRYDSHLGMI